MYLHPLSIFSTLYQKIDYSSLLVCVTRQKSTQSKSRLSCRRTNIWITVFLLLDRQRKRESEREREKRKRKETERKGGKR